MDIPGELTNGPLPTSNNRALNIFTIVKFTISATISMAAFIYGLILVYIQPRVWHSPIVRIIIVAQVINSLRFAFRLVVIFANVHADFGCRALLFLNNILSILPVNLCIYCVVYLQMVIIHNLSPQKRWPRVVILTVATTVSVVPALWFLFWPARLIGARSFCHLPRIMENNFYHFLIGTTLIWAYLPGFIGMISISCIAVHIVRTRRKTRQVLQESNRIYGSLQDLRQPDGSNLLHRTIINIIWFPIVPILSLWFNVVLVSVFYYKKRTYMCLDYINVLLLGLQSILLAVALVVNPIARTAMSEYWQKRRREKNILLETTEIRTVSSFGLPPVHSHSIIAENEIGYDP